MTEKKTLYGFEIKKIKSDFEKIQTKYEQKGIEISELNVVPLVVSTLELILNDKKFGSTFVPEIDGKELIKQYLPIIDTINQEKQSQMYKEVLVAYRLIMRELMERTNSMGMPGGTYGVSSQKQGLDDMETRIYKPK